jgi:AraC family transcriptional regulator
LNEAGFQSMAAAIPQRGPVNKLEPVRYQTGRPMLLGGLRRRHEFAELARSIPEQWRQFESMAPIPGRLGTDCYGVICGTHTDGFEYMCAVEVAGLDRLPAELGRMRIAEQRYAVFRHADQVSTIAATWQRILHEWLPAAGCLSAQRPDFERYDSAFDPATGLGGVEIWIAIADERGAVAPVAGA